MSLSHLSVYFVKATSSYNIFIILYTVMYSSYYVQLYFITYLATHIAFAVDEASSVGII